ncbi:hypothetical protein KCP77_22685 [Salmonella enterica subsp. enterica]|nr:hypothetical protein KCP77_22685 [Salmonella enterica subsp. enterica]
MKWIDLADWNRQMIMSWPFSPREVSARVRALLRRVKSLLRRRGGRVPDILDS